MDSLSFEDALIDLLNEYGNTEERYYLDASKWRFNLGYSGNFYFVTVGLTLELEEGVELTKEFRDFFYIEESTPKQVADSIILQFDDFRAKYHAPMSKTFKEL